MAILQKSDSFIFKQVKGSTVMLNGQTGDYFGLNAVGTDFLKLVDGVRTTDEIIGELQNTYEVDEATLRSDIETLTKNLIDKGILFADDSI